MRKENLQGRRFGCLVVIGEAERNKHKQTLWLCRCDCGTVKTVRAQQLKIGGTISCGCVKRLRMALLKKTHGMKHSRIYECWGTMIQRCTNPRNHKWKDYGARGITVCERWKSFDNFLADMGEKPDALTLERIDNDGPYSPVNCRWATPTEQQHNKRTNLRITIKGETLTATQWARRVGVRPSIIFHRLSYGWTPEEAILTPVREWHHEPTKSVC